MPLPTSPLRSSLVWITLSECGTWEKCTALLAPTVDREEFREDEEDAEDIEDDRVTTNGENTP